MKNVRFLKKGNYTQKDAKKMTHRMTEEPISYRMTPAEKRLISGAATLLTTDQVAEIFGMQKQTIYHWVRVGKLDAIKLPGEGGRGKLRFRRDYIERLIGGEI